MKQKIIRIIKFGENLKNNEKQNTDIFGDGCIRVRIDSIDSNNIGLYWFLVFLYGRQEIFI